MIPLIDSIRGASQDNFIDVDESATALRFKGADDGAVKSKLLFKIAI